MMANVKNTAPTSATDVNNNHPNNNRTMLYLNSIAGKLNTLNDEFFMDFTDSTNHTLSQLRKSQRNQDKEMQVMQPPTLPALPAIPPAISPPIPPPIPPPQIIKFPDGNYGYAHGSVVAKIQKSAIPVYDDGSLVDVRAEDALDYSQRPRTPSAIDRVLDQGIQYNQIIYGKGLEQPKTEAVRNEAFVADTEETQDFD